MSIIAAADGSALGNPGPAGWAWYVDEAHWASGGWPHGTNNMGELTAVLELLRATEAADEELVVFCDSTYAINTITKWMAGWKRRGWRKGDGKPVMNLEIVQALDEAMAGRKVRFEWVKGHAGHELNEAADKLANAAATAFRDGRPVDAGPGWDGAAGGCDAADPALFDGLDEYHALDEIEQVVALERSLLTDEVRSDRATVAGMLHDDWREIGRSGRLWERAEMLDRIGPIDPVELEVVSATRPTPDTVLLVWRAIPASGEPALRSSLWVREGAGWRQVFHQGTTEA